MTCNGVEGVTNTDGFDVTVFWEQGFGLDGLLDNSTCGYEEDITMSCVDNGAEPSVALFDNIANNFHSSGSSQNFQVRKNNINQLSYIKIFNEGPNFRSCCIIRLLNGYERHAR